MARKTVDMEPKTVEASVEESGVGPLEAVEVTASVEVGATLE